MFVPKLFMLFLKLLATISSLSLLLSLSLSKCLIILVLFTFQYPGQSGKRSKLRVSWRLFVGSRWSLANSEISCLYVFSLIR